MKPALTPTVQRIVPNIWCNGNAEEAGEYYARTFENASFEVESRYPETGLLDFQQPLAGQPLTVALTIAGYRFTLVNAGNEFHPNPSLSFMLNVDPLLFDSDELLARASLEKMWHGLVDGGRVLMPLGEYPFSALYGWVEDRFGVSWQLILTDPAGEPRPFILPALLFGEAAQDRAGEAVDHYLYTFRGFPGGAAPALVCCTQSPTVLQQPVRCSSVIFVSESSGSLPWMRLPLRRSRSRPGSPLRSAVTARSRSMRYGMRFQQCRRPSNVVGWLTGLG